MTRFRVRSSLSLALASVLALSVSGCGKPAEQRSQTPAKAGEIAWRQGDVEDAFAEAREQNKPVLLYWGAVWCPPCNRLKSGLFRDPEFIARTRDFIPVYLDGDSSGAQAWGERFGIQGYPTLIVLRPDRSEVTRLSSSADTAQVEAVLDAVQRGGRNIEPVLKDALAQPQKLSEGEWTLLAGYGWGLDNGRLVPGGDVAGVLGKLAAAAPDGPVRRRFVLQALASRKPGAAPLDAGRQGEARAALDKVLADANEREANRETLVRGAVPLLLAASAPGGDRQQLAGRIDAALNGFATDEKAGTADRLSPLGAQIDLARVQAGEKAPLPRALVDKVKAQVAWADGKAKDAYERQSLISTAAHLLSDIGDDAGAEKLLKAELTRSKTPYYYMPSLAKLAEQRGDKAGAVDWLRKGYETSEGPASRIQWGVSYVEGLVRLKPDDKAAIGDAAGKVVGELANQPAGYRQRTRQRLEGLGKTLAQWSAAHDGAATLTRLRNHTDAVCAKQSDQAASAACKGWLGAG